MTALVVCVCVLTFLAFCWTCAFLMPVDQGYSRLERLIRAKERNAA